MGPYKDKPCYLCGDRDEGGYCHIACPDYLRIKELIKKAKESYNKNNLYIIRTTKVKINPIKRRMYKE